MFSKGNKVYSILTGYEGVVTNIYDSTPPYIITYPVAVRFQDLSEALYTLKGEALFGSGIQILYLKDEEEE